LFALNCGVGSRGNTVPLNIFARGLEWLLILHQPLLLKMVFEVGLLEVLDAYISYRNAGIIPKSAICVGIH
jgi:hypothetical protein